jgi:endonuclease/exonuclease/phosphatase family metal-dependent hydrolase
VTALSAQTDNCKIITWNIRDFGKTKSDAEIELMAKILRGYDVIAIQEVVAKDPGGAQAVARLADAMDKTGANYDYSVSDPTQSSSPHTRERYAYIWRTSTVEMIGRPQLLSAYAKTIEREPYFATFSWEGKEFNVVNLHARPTINILSRK